MNVNSSLNSCLYGILQCEGNTNLYLLCDMTSLSVIKCVVHKDFKLWLWLEEIIFLSISIGVVIDCLATLHNVGPNMADFLTFIRDSVISVTDEYDVTEMTQ